MVEKLSKQTLIQPQKQVSVVQDLQQLSTAYFSESNIIILSLHTI